MIVSMFMSFDFYSIANTHVFVYTLYIHTDETKTGRCGNMRCVSLLPILMSSSSNLSNYWCVLRGWSKIFSCYFCTINHLISSNFKWINCHHLNKITIIVYVEREEMTVDALHVWIYKMKLIDIIKWVKSSRHVCS